MLIDSHCHLDCLEFPDKTISQLLTDAKAADVSYFLTICTRLDSFTQVLDIAKNHDVVFASVGQHPSEQVAIEPTVEDILVLAKHPLVIGIGETGLDYHYKDVDQKLQRERFAAHIEVAKTLKKPLIIHTREAQNDTIDIMKSEKVDNVGGVMHCFTEDWEFAKLALDLNFYISFSGILTFKNAGGLREVAKKVPIDRILVETDAPYLAPVPYRGKQNQPAYVRQVAEFLATLRGISYQELANKTTENFFDLFDLF